MLLYLNQGYNHFLGITFILADFKIRAYGGAMRKTTQFGMKTYHLRFKIHRSPQKLLILISKMTK